MPRRRTVTARSGATRLVLGDVVGVPCCSPERHGQTCRGSYETASTWARAAVGRRAAAVWLLWRCNFGWRGGWPGGVAAVATVAAAHAVAWGVGMFGYGGRQGLGRGLKVQCGGGRGEYSRVCLCAGTAVLPGQGVSGVVAKAAAVAKGELCGMGSDGPGIYGAWWLRHGWCGDVGRAVRWCVRWCGSNG